ncbi:MAG: polysaccharide deacetylase family protein [Oscillospiraceae bacterium]|nr:polysaccharide deacetylase family protein [Oscillospiraceae bacterium]
MKNTREKKKRSTIHNNRSMKLIASVLCVAMCLSASLLFYTAPGAEAADIPKMYVNDRVFTSNQTQPYFKDINENLYIPVDMFLEFSYITWSSTGVGAFYIENTRTHSYISYTSQRPDRIKYNNGWLPVNTVTHNEVSYLPAKYAPILDVKLETDTYDGKLYVRLKDSSAQLTLLELTESFRPVVIPDPPDPPDPPDTTDPTETIDPTETMDPPNPQEPEVNTSAIALTFTDFSGDRAESILKYLRENDLSATIFFTADEIISSPSLVRRAAIDGHVIGIRIDSGNEYNAVIEINSAQSALLKVLKRKTRLIRISDGVDYDADMLNNKLSAMGCSLCEVNIPSKDGKYKVSASFEMLKNQMNESDISIIGFTSANNTLEILKLLHDYVGEHDVLSFFTVDETNAVIFDKAN